MALFLMGGAPIGARGHDHPLFEAKWDGDIILE